MVYFFGFSNIWLLPNRPLAPSFITLVFEFVSLILNLYRMNSPQKVQHGAPFYRGRGEGRLSFKWASAATTFGGPKSGGPLKKGRRVHLPNFCVCCSLRLKGQNWFQEWTVGGRGSNVILAQPPYTDQLNQLNQINEMKRIKQINQINKTQHHNPSGGVLVARINKQTSKLSIIDHLLEIINYL